MALNEGVIMAHGASIALIHPVTWFPRIIVNAYRRSRHLDIVSPDVKVVAERMHIPLQTYIIRRLGTALTVFIIIGERRLGTIP